MNDRQQFTEVTRIFSRSCHYICESRDLKVAFGYIANLVMCSHVPMNHFSMFIFQQRNYPYLLGESDVACELVLALQKSGLFQKCEFGYFRKPL